MKRKKEKAEKREARIAAGLPPEDDDDIAEREAREKLLAEKRAMLGANNTEGTGAIKAEEEDEAYVVDIKFFDNFLKTLGYDFGLLA